MPGLEVTGNMGILSWLFKGPIERTLDLVPSSGDSALDATERRQARALDNMSSYDAEHVSGWTGPNHDQPVFEYRDLSDIWAEQRKGK